MLNCRLFVTMRIRLTLYDNGVRAIHNPLFLPLIPKKRQTRVAAPRRRGGRAAAAAAAAVLGRRRHEGEGPARDGRRLGRQRGRRAVLARVGGGSRRRQVDPAVAARAARTERKGTQTDIGYGAVFHTSGVQVHPRIHYVQYRPRYRQTWHSVAISSGLFGPLSSNKFSKN